MTSRTTARPRRDRRARPTLEALDHRQLLAILVTSGADSGPGTLRAAIQQNEGSFGDDIRIQDGVGEIVLTSGSLNSTTRFRIVGPASGVTIRRSQATGTPTFSLFKLDAARVGFDSWRFENLTLLGGAGGDVSGGAISAKDGNLTLANCTVADNTAIVGAGVFLTGTGTVTGFTPTLSVSNSTFRNNRTVAAGSRAASSGGALTITGANVSIASSLIVGNEATNGSAIFSTGTGRITNSTVVGNVNTFSQGVVSSLGGSLEIVGSTITGNRGGPGSQGFGVGGVNGINVRLVNSIVAGNIGGDLTGTVTVGTNNLIGDGSGNLDPTTNLRNVDPMLGPLRDNGGPTLTIMPLPGSPAIDAGTLPPFAADVDQRYAARPINDRFDIGAVETGNESPGLVVNTEADVVDPQDGLTSLREAVAFGNRLGGARRITFDPARFATPRTITLSPEFGTITLADETEIVGPAAGVTVARSTAAGTRRFGLFLCPNGEVASRTTFRRVTLTGGDASNGSAFVGLGGTLVLDSCNIVGNRTTGNGGAILGDILIATNTSFVNNSATVFGGAIRVNTATLDNCTLAGNVANNGIGAVDAGFATLTNCTIVGNTSAAGLGSVGNVATIRNSIVADNIGGDLAGTFNGSGNLIGDGSGGLDPATNLLNVRPNLSPLQTAGLTSFFVPLPGSPARDGGVSALVPSGVAVDQRGLARIRGARVDIGSVETDPGAAAVASLSAGVPDGPYGTGRVIPIAVRFSKAVVVQGTPTLALNSGGAATFSSGSGTDTLTFLYTVRKGESASRLEANALALGSGGSIRDADFNSTDLTLPAAGASGSLGSASNIAIDTVAPQVVAFRVLFGSRSFDVLTSTRINLPWRITGIQAVFSKPVASGSAASLAGVAATGVTGLGTSTLTWTFGAIDAAILNTSLQGTGPAALSDAAGNALAEGLGFSRTLRILNGDANDDGMVSTADVSRVLGATKRPYDVFSDINGDGVVDLLDVNLTRSLIGRRL